MCTMNRNDAKSEERWLESMRTRPRPARDLVEYPILAYRGMENGDHEPDLGKSSPRALTDSVHTKDCCGSTYIVYTVQLLSYTNSSFPRFGGELVCGKTARGRASAITVPVDKNCQSISLSTAIDNASV